MTKCAKRANLECFGAILGQGWIAYDSSKKDGRIWRFKDKESARKKEETSSSSRR